MTPHATARDAQHRAQPAPIALAPLLAEREAERDLPIPAPQWIEAPELRGDGERRLTRTASGILIGAAWSPPPPPPSADAEWIQSAMLARRQWASAEVAAGDDEHAQHMARVRAGWPLVERVIAIGCAATLVIVATDWIGWTHFLPGAR